MTRLRVATPRQVLTILCIFSMLPPLSACSGVVSTVSDHVQETVSGAIAPVRGAIDEAARRANEVGEGVNQVTDGISRVKGAFAGSGSTW
jgi:phage-related protein